jgi:hypothetical protein
MDLSLDAVGFLRCSGEDNRFEFESGFALFCSRNGAKRM